MKYLLLIVIILFTTNIYLSQEIAKSNIAYKTRKWKQLDAITLNNGKLLSWEQHGKGNFIRLYKQDLKLDKSFKIADNKQFLKSSTTKIIEYNNNYYIIYDGELEDKQHKLFAQKIDIEKEILENNKKIIGSFKTNLFVKGYFEIQDKNTRRILISYHQKITTDYHQKIYVNLLNENLESINERIYTFNHKGRLFRKIKYLMLPNNDVLAYGEIYRNHRLATVDELKREEESAYKIIKISIFKNKDAEQKITIDNYIISDLIIRLKENKLLTGGFYSDYSNLHNKGFFKVLMSLDLEELEPIKKIEFSSEFTNKIIKSISNNKDKYIQQTNSIYNVLQNRIKTKTKERGGLYSLNLIDLEQTENSTNFLAGVNYKYSAELANTDKSNSSIISYRRNNYIESDILYVKTNFEKITNYQQIPRFNITKSYRGFLQPTVKKYTHKGNEYLAFMEIGKYTLYEKIKDDYTFSEIATLDYQKEYKKRGDSFSFNPKLKQMYSYKKDFKRTQIIKIN